MAVIVVFAADTAALLKSREFPRESALRNGAGAGTVSRWWPGGGGGMGRNVLILHVKVGPTGSDDSTYILQ